MSYLRGYQRNTQNLCARMKPGSKGISLFTDPIECSKLKPPYTVYRKDNKIGCRVVNPSCTMYHRSTAHQVTTYTYGVLYLYLTMSSAIGLGVSGLSHESRCDFAFGTFYSTFYSARLPRSILVVPCSRFLAKCLRLFLSYCQA